MSAGPLLPTLPPSERSRIRAKVVAAEGSIPALVEPAVYAQSNSREVGNPLMSAVFGLTAFKTSQ
jgi:hypothetical protein